MFRSIIVIAAVATLPAPAVAKNSVLAAADQDRVVCVPKRDAAGKRIGGEFCQTGREWEIALTKLRPKNAGWSSVYNKSAYLAGPGYYQTDFRLVAHR